MAIVPYTWNLPKNVCRDAKYSIRGKKVGLLYRTDYGEEWSLSTDDHPELLAMVNRVKVEANGAPGGAFYINEYRQVIVPATDGNTDAYFYAGEYHKDLEFLFEGKVVSGRAVALDGLVLQPGDTWEGVHPGIPYVLKAGGKDISFKHPIRPNVTREEKLSRYAGAGPALNLAHRIRMVKGFEGGRFYVNERREVFAPTNEQTGLSYVYIGRLAASDPWFPKWQPESSAKEKG
ncbi:MAG TPA: hypothetical protein VNA25_17165 [Phycisphaerae bacterium]|nr:hypothetical protein [Phycisphaerae bacterium]